MTETNPNTPKELELVELDIARDAQPSDSTRDQTSIWKKAWHKFNHYWKFLLIPGYRLNSLTAREEKIEKTKSKRKFIRRLKSSLTILGIVLVLIVTTMAVFAPWLSDYPYQDLLTGVFSGSWSPPSPEHPMGTTKFGRDVLGRFIWGARSSLTIGLGSIMFSLVIGIVLGITAAYKGGRTDSIIMRIMDILLAFPGLVLALVFISIWGPRVQYIMLAYGILGIPAYARLIRGSAIQVKENVYIQAAKAAGASDSRIMFKHVLPNAISPVIVAFTFDIGGIILSLAGISFLGFGDSTLIEWGNDINVGRLHIYEAPWVMFWPGLGIVITVLGFMLLGDGLRDALDPRLKNLV